MINQFFIIVYIFSIACLSIYGLQALILSVLFMLKWKHNPPIPPEPSRWPSLTVQLPIFNEKYVVGRLIDAVCALDYPAERLSVQVLDDSTDKTTCLAAYKVRYYRKRGVDITLLHRKNRSGYKAGALAAALPLASGELIAVFDADFQPPKDFLKRLVPYLAADPHLGMVQARWTHLNADYNLLTRSQALMLDGHFVIEQTARSRSGLLFNFNGSGGIWRKSCIVDAGGWQDDTLAEDLDLSYRAQLKGWRISYLPHVIIPAEIPPQIAAFKKQQYRWTRGGVQVLRKYFTHFRAGHGLSAKQRIMAFVQLTGNLSNVLILLGLLCSLPIVLMRGQGLPYSPWLSLAGVGGPLLFGLSQVSVYKDWLRRLINLPILLCMRIGLTFNNSRAVIAGLGQKTGVFERTPKYHLESRQDLWQRNKYRLRLDIDIIAELLLGVYSAVTLGFAITDFHRLILPLAMFTFSFFFTGIMGLAQAISQSSKKQIRLSSSEFYQLQPERQPAVNPHFKQPIY